MKTIKFILLFLAVSISAINAQTVQKVNVEGIKKDIAKAVEASEHPKKGAKASTWIKLAETYFEASEAHTEGLYRGLSSILLTSMYGKKDATKTTIGQQEYELISYPAFDVYIQNGQVSFWNQKQFVDKAAVEKAVAALDKAVELDPKAADKASELYSRAVDYYKQQADTYNGLTEYSNAGDNFVKAYELQKDSPLAVIDTVSLYNSGLFFTVGKDSEKAIKSLNGAKELDYLQGGELFYYLYHNYYLQQNYEMAKTELYAGLELFPENKDIIEGLLVVYAATGEDPTDIIPIVQEAIDKDPTNPFLWSGLGRIYDQLKQVENSLGAFAKVAELQPEDFGANYNYGLLLVKKADSFAEDMNARTFTSDEYKAKVAELNKLFSEALPALEKAYSLNPTDESTLTLLKSITFRLRDESPEMTEKSKKYKEAYDALPAA